MAFTIIVIVGLLVVVVLLAGTKAGKKGVDRSPSRSTSASNRGFSVALGFQSSIPSAQPTRHDAGTLRWTGQEAVRVAGLSIPCPMTYVLDGAASEQACREPSAISSRWAVGEGWTAEELPYWPWYSRLSPLQRRMYLSWLAGGRQTLPSEDGYLFIYFYGLERRALIDDADLAVIVPEVRRLRELHAAALPARSKSFQRYSSAFLWHLTARRPRAFSPEAIRAIADGTASWSEDTLAAALSWFAATGMAMPEWMARIVAEQLPTSVRSVVTRRVEREFDRLFAKRFQDEYPQGMRLRVSKRPLRSAYQPASAGLHAVTVEAPHPMGIPSQFKVLSETWNVCVEELRSFSSAAKEGGDLSARAWESMPADIRAGVDHPHAAAYNRVINAATDAEGGSFVRIGMLAAASGLAARETLTLKQSRELAQSAEHIGYCLEPDPRITGTSYDWDELVAVFLRLDDHPLDHVRFSSAACMMQLGMSIAAADGEAAEMETALITTSIEGSFNLSDQERRRLEALRDLLVKTGSDSARLTKRLQATLTVEQRGAIGRLLVAIAGADGNVTTPERRALRKAYRSLGLEPTTLDVTLAGVALKDADEPVTIRGADTGPPTGERIPQPPVEAALRLDRAAVAAIMAETREVAALLAQAMAVAEVSTEAEPVEAPPPVPSQAVAGAALSARYRPLLDELVGRDRWTMADVESAARRHGLMAAGAIESINDWTLEATGYALLHDEGEHLTVDRSALPVGG